MEHEINQLEERFLQAFRDLNTNELIGFIHDRLIYKDPSGKILTKQMDLEAFQSANLSIESLACLDRKIELFDKEVAIVCTTLHLKASAGSHPIDGRTRFLRTWKKFEDGWKIIAASSTNLP